MNFDNITKENFKEYLEVFNELLLQINFSLFENENKDNPEVNFENEDNIEVNFEIEIDNEDTDPEIIQLYKLNRNDLGIKDIFNLIDIRFKKLFKFSHNNDIFFRFCSSKVYENTFEGRFKDFENKFIDVDKNEFIKKEIEEILNSKIFRYNLFSNENKIIIKNAKFKKIEFLKSISKDINFNIIKKDELSLLDVINRYEVEIKTETPIITKPKANKSLLFNGSNLNLSERFKIANEVLNIDNKIRTLNIQDLEKYQLLAYILGCDKDNARNLMNGSYRSKDRDLSKYFDDLGLNR